jgi:hypothetical protein
LRRLNKEEQMKSAQKFLDDFRAKVGLPVHISISLCEAKPEDGLKENWIASVGNLPPDVNSRYNKSLHEMKELHPNIDWSGINSPPGERRSISGVRTA